MPQRDRLLLLIACCVLVMGMGVSLRRVHVTTASTSGNGYVTSIAEDPPTGWQRRSLSPVANPDSAAPPQPARLRPFHVAVAANGKKAFVTLSGKEICPGTEVSVIDVQRRTEVNRIVVGAHPCGIALHPSGRWLIVANRYSNFLSVIDARTERVVSEIPVIFYCEDITFSLNGRIAYVSNFWTNQILVIDLAIEEHGLTGRTRSLGFDEGKFFGEVRHVSSARSVCTACGWHEGNEGDKCLRCGHSPLHYTEQWIEQRVQVGLATVIRANCGTSGCHLYRTGDFYAGPDDTELFRSVVGHSFPGDPDGSPLLSAAISARDGGWADAIDGRHHAGGIIFRDIANNPDVERLRAWITEGVEGPGIPVGDKPRDMAISADGMTLYVANTGSADISVVDLRQLRETRRIFTRSVINDIIVVDGQLIAASLGSGTGHPKCHDPARESTDRNAPEAEFTLFRDLATGRPLPFEEQQPLGAYDTVDGTAQEKFRDITNDIIVMKPAVENVASYEANELFTRYTSDSFEALAGDKKGDVSPALMKVVGAFPEQIVQSGDRFYVAMSGTFQVQEWQLNLQAEPEHCLTPGRVFETEFKPTGIDIAGNTLIVVNHLSESITFIDLDRGETMHLNIRSDAAPFPINDFERGEFFVQSSVFSVDQDQSCVHCHFRDTSDGRRWSVSQVMGQSRQGEERTGGSREVPDLRNLFQEVPFFVEGTLTLDEPLTMMMEHNPLVDFQGKTPAGDFDHIYADPAEVDQYARSADAIVSATTAAWSRNDVQLVDLIKRREVHFSQISEKYLGRVYRFRDFQQFIGAYQAGEPRLLPNPADPDDPMVRQGRALFNDPKVGCASCHPAPTFTDKIHPHNENKSFPPVVSSSARDNTHTLISADRVDFLNGYQRPWDPDDVGRVESREGFFVAPSLRGIWARPPVFLHHGRAISMREVICTPDHPALRRLPQPRHDIDRIAGREIGLNELNGVPDSHGTTSHLSVWEIECLLGFIQSIE